MTEYGEFLRGERLARGLRQSDLAAGICSVDTISRIEKGNQMPSASLFTSLLQRLGVSGFSYGDFFSSHSIAMMELRTQIVDRLEMRRLDELPMLLGEYKDRLTAGDVWDEQFFRFATAKYFYCLDRDAAGLLRICDEAIRLTIRDFDPVGGWYGRHFTNEELSILNEMAVVLFTLRRHRESAVMFNRLIGRQRTASPIHPFYWRNLAILCNNAAICEVAQFPREANEHIESALRHVKRYGNEFLVLRLVRTWLVLFGVRHAKCPLYAKILKYHFHEWNRDSGRYRNYRAFLGESYFLEII